MPSLPVFTFTGGQTDNPLGARPDQWQKAENLVVSQDLKLESAPGGTLKDSVDPRVTASLSTYRIGSLISFYGSLFKHVGTTIQYFDGSTQVNLQGPESSPVDAFATITDTEAIVTSSFWNNHQFAVHDEEANLQPPVKWFDDGSAFFLTTAGLPLYPVSGTAADITISSAGGTGNTYRYAFIYKYTYQVDGITFIDREAPSFKTLSNVGAPNTNTVTIDDFVGITNTSATHYDVTNTTDLRIEIYRTTASGSIFYYLTDVPVDQGSTGISDTTSDATLALNEVAYWTGGVAYNNRPPAAKILHMTTSYGYYAAGLEVLSDDSDGELLRNRLWQSKANDPDSVPPQFFVDVEDEIVGVSSVRSIPIVFCKNGAIYRIDGYFDDFGRGGMIAQKINEVAGCIGQLSLVQSLDGVYFGGIDNWYFTDGFVVSPLTDELRSTYANLTSSEILKKRMCGTYDGLQKRVYWACRVDTDEGESDDNNAIAVCDIRNRAFLFWGSGFDDSIATTKTIGTTNLDQTATCADTSGLEVGQYVFADGVPLNSFITSITTNTSIELSNAAVATATVSADFLDDDRRGPQFYNQFLPTALAIFNNTLVTADVRGYLITRSETSTTTAKIDPAVDPDDWQVNPVLYRYISAAQDFERPDLRKWCTQLVLHVRSKSDISSNLTLQPRSENDADNAPSDMKPMQEQFGTLWGDPSISYGDPVLYQNISRLVIEKRHFPKKSLRCSYKTVHLESLWANIQRSDLDGAATISGSGVTRTVTITGEWNSDCVDQYVTFATDDYTAEYKIVERTSSTAVVIAVPEDDLVNASDLEWLTRGYVKGDTIYLIGYVIGYELMDNTVKPFQGASNINASSNA